MNTISFIQDKGEIIRVFEKLQSPYPYPFEIANFTFHDDDASVSYSGNVDFRNKNLTHLPFKFRRVSGDFDISWNSIGTLLGCPEYVGGNFGCRHNNLSSLKNGPKTVGKIYSCDYNPLINLIGIPKKYERICFTVNDSITNHLPWLERRAKLFKEFFDNRLIYVQPNFLKNKKQLLAKNTLIEFIEDQEEIIKVFKKLQNPKYPFDITKFTFHEDDSSVSYNDYVDFSHNNLTHLPFRFRHVSGSFTISHNDLTTLLGCPKTVGRYFYCDYNNLATLYGGPQQIGRSYCCYENPIQSLNLRDFPDTYAAILLPDTLPDREISWLKQIAVFGQEFVNGVLYRPNDTIYVQRFQ